MITLQVLGLYILIILRVLVNFEYGEDLGIGKAYCTVLVHIMLAEWSDPISLLIYTSILNDACWWRYKEAFE